MAMITVKLDAGAAAADISEMQEMPDEGYRGYIRDTLFFVDHHEVLRSLLGAYPIATASQQVRLTIEYLHEVAAHMIQAGK